MNEPKKDNRGYLYPNTNKNKPTQPDFTGKVTIDNKEWRLSAWENKSPDGKKYLSISVSVPLENSQPGPGGQPIQQNKNKVNHQPDITQDDLEDLDAILKLTDDDNPFN